MTQSLTQGWIRRDSEGVGTLHMLDVGLVQKEKKVESRFSWLHDAVWLSLIWSKHKLDSAQLHTVSIFSSTTCMNFHNPIY